MTTSHFPKDDRIFHKEALFLKNQGYDVIIIAQHDDDAVIDGIRIIPLHIAKRRLDRYVINVFHALWLAFQVRADAYHFHDPELLFAGFIMKLAGKVVIYDVHEDYQQKLLSKHFSGKRLAAGIWRIVESTLSRFFNHVFTADSHTKQHFPPHKTTVLANYPPLRFTDVVRHRKEDGVFRIVYAGGIDCSRGIAKTIDALELLSDIPVEFHVAGPPPDGPLMDRMSQHSKVVYHGLLPWEEVNSLLAECDLGVVLLQPVPAYLYCPGENIIKLFEYMGVGLPVLISNFPRLKHLIESIDAGKAVEPTSPEKIATAIKELRHNPALLRRMGENGRRAVLEKYNWEHEGNKMLAVYSQLTGMDQ